MSRNLVDPCRLATKMASLSVVVQFFHKYIHHIMCIFLFSLVITTIGNLQVFVSKQTLSYWDSESSVLMRFLWDAALLLIFIIQHSFMATEWFKIKLSSWLNITVSERFIYVAVSSLTLMFLIIQWQSIPETFIWFIDTQKLTLLWIFFLLLHIVGWFILGLELLLMDISEMLGLSQIYNYHNNLAPPLLKKARKLKEIYSRMRHPGAVCLTALLWLHPLMTLDRVLLASVLTSYMIGRHSLEESHYDFAEKYFTVHYTEKKSTSSVLYEYRKEN